MRTITLSQVQPGMELARNLFDDEGNMLLKKGIKLTAQYIKGLQSLGLPALYVTDPLLEDLEDRFLLPEALHREALICLSGLFRSQVSDFFRPGKNRDMRFHQLNQTVDRLVREISGRCADLVNYHICHLGNSIIDHSLYVCLLSIVTGLAANLSASALKELALGALLHDLGKLRLPGHILNKPGAPTVKEMQEIHRHPAYGYDIVSFSDEISPAAAFTVLQHHERFNGSGYAAGLRGEEIHLFGRICAIADVFAAMTADRVYRPALPRREVIEKMVSAGHGHFDLRQLRLFLQNIPVYPLGSRVILSTGEQGYVVRNYAKATLRPVVRIVADHNGHPLTSFRDIDLLSTQYAHVVKVSTPS